MYMVPFIVLMIRSMLVMILLKQVHGQLDSPESPETPEITKMTENFTQVTKYLNKFKET